QPANQLVPLALTLGLYWLVLVHYLARRPPLMAAALAALLGVACFAAFKLWILYSTDPAAEKISLTIPFLVTAAASFIMMLVLQDLARVRRPRAPAKLTRWIASVVGGTLFVATLVAALVRPEDWYLILDTIFAEEVPKGHVGVLLAPYDRDPKDDAR